MSVLAYEKAAEAGDMKVHYEGFVARIMADQIDGEEEMTLFAEAFGLAVKVLRNIYLIGYIDITKSVT